LAANDERWDDLHQEFCVAVLHQGGTYSSSAPALRILAQLAAAPELAAKRRLDLLDTLFRAGAALDEAVARGYRPDAYAAEVRTAVVGEVDQLLTMWPAVSPAEQRILLLLAALAGREVEPIDLPDPASRLALAMVHNPAKAEEVLRDIASRNEDIMEFAEGEAPLHSRLIASLQALIG
jgi:hypothetical protein